MKIILSITLLLTSTIAYSMDIQRGRMLTETRGCIGCHGSNGMSLRPEVPHLAGQRADYLRKSLRSYRSGRRTDPTMNSIARQLNDVDIQDIADYYESLR